MPQQLLALLILAGLLSTTASAADETTGKKPRTEQAPAKTPAKTKQKAPKKESPPPTPTLDSVSHGPHPKQV
ncbi:MAG: hypothetical protein ACOVRM_16565, partial [Planctomycetaceae bacterium]